MSPSPCRVVSRHATHLGLIYDMDGNHKFLKDNKGTKPWPKMQRKLNAVLDRIASKSDPQERESAVQVQALGVGTVAMLTSLRSMTTSLPSARLMQPTAAGASSPTPVTHCRSSFEG